MRRIGRAAFRPSVADLRVLDEAVAVACRSPTRTARPSRSTPRTRRGTRGRRSRASGRRARSRTAASRRRRPTGTRSRSTTARATRSARSRAGSCRPRAGTCRRKSSAVRVAAKSPEDVMASAVHSASRPNIHAKPGPLALPRGPEAGQEPGAEQRVRRPFPCRCPTFAHAKAVSTRGSGVEIPTVRSCERAVVGDVLLVERGARGAGAARRSPSPPPGPPRCPRGRSGTQVRAHPVRRARRP